MLITRRAFFQPATFSSRHHPRSLLWMSSEQTESNSNTIEPTWVYTPYDPKKQNNQQQPRRRTFSEWKVPKTITIPEDQLDMSFVRSSGAGGQNVNKVNTQVMIKFHVLTAEWVGPLEVRRRLQEQQANRINKEGFMTLSSQEYRTQQQNRKAVVSKLQGLILKAYPRPKVRKMRKGISKKAKAQNKENKKKRSDTKANRRRVDY